MKGVTDQNNASLEWMNEKKRMHEHKDWKLGMIEWMDKRMKGRKQGSKEERKEGMNEPKEWDFGNFRKVKFEMINLCKVGIEKNVYFLSSTLQCNDRKTNGHICSLSSSLFLQK
jgi:hypothetical protein